MSAPVTRFRNGESGDSMSEHNQDVEYSWQITWVGRQPERSKRLARRASDYLLDAVFVTRGSGDHARDILVCVRPHGDDLEEVMDARIPGAAYGYYLMGVRGPDEPYSRLPDVDVVHVVGHGGVDSEFGDTGLDWNMVEIFTDLEMARAAAREDPSRDMTIQTMVLDEMLPIPAIELTPTPAQSRRLAARECIARLASNFHDFAGSPGSVVYSSTSLRAQKPSAALVGNQSRIRVASGVLAFLAFKRSPDLYTQGQDAHAHLFAVTRSIPALVDLVETLLEHGDQLDLGWEQHYLQGDNAPFRDGPAIDVVYIVYAGEAITSPSSMEPNRVIIGVFADDEAAKGHCADSGREDARVEAVPLDVILLQSE